MQSRTRSLVELPRSQPSERSESRKTVQQSAGESNERLGNPRHRRLLALATLVALDMFVLGGTGCVATGESAAGHPASHLCAA